MNGQGEDLAGGDNKNLLDLLIMVLKYKGLIVSCLLLVYLMTFAYLYFFGQRTLPPASSAKSAALYYSESVLWIPDNGMYFMDPNKIRAQFASRSTLVAVGKLLNVSAICQGRWDEKSNNWFPERVYLLDKGTREWVSAEPSTVPNLSEVATLFIKSQDKLVTLRFNYTDPGIPQKALISGLEYMGEFLRKPVLDYYESQKQIFQKQLAGAPDPVLKGRLFEQYSNLIDKETRAKEAKYFGMEIVDPPFGAEKIPAAGKAAPSGPGKRKYAAIMALMTLVALLIAIPLVYLIEYVKNLKQKDPERFDLIRKYAGFRK